VERPILEVADIFRAHGPAWRRTERGHLSLGQLKVMSAIEQCRSIALGGHALRCSACAEPQIAYNSCRNRHCPKCQSSAAQRWLEARQADLLPVEYYHVVFTLPAPISAIAYTNKEIIYSLLFDIAAETLRTIAALKFFGEHIDLADADAFADWLSPLRQCEWVVYAKRPFSGPEAVLAYLSRYTHRVAISNRRLLACDDRGVTFRWKDYRAQGSTRHKTMTLMTDEFMRRFLLHVLPVGFHRIRHYGLLANANRKTHIATARDLLHQPAPPPTTDAPTAEGATRALKPTFVCRHCGAPMLVIETFPRAQHIRGPPASARPP
jgi:hypothetical protein